MYNNVKKTNKMLLFFTYVKKPSVRAVCIKHQKHVIPHAEDVIVRQCSSTFTNDNM